MNQDDYLWYLHFLATIGTISLFALLFDPIWSLLQVITISLFPEKPQTLRMKFGSWALVTGSTDGIGKQYAKQLARRGINVILVSRSEEKLKQTANEIELKYSVKTKIIIVDFSTGPKTIETIKRELENFPPIGILVNNVGIAPPYPMYLEEIPEQDLWDMININVGAVTMMTRLLIPKMKEQGRGAIVNISSGAELQPLMLQSIYSSTKVYIKFFTEVLRQEYSKYGITIQNVTPFVVKTKMNSFSSSLQGLKLATDAETVANYAVHYLGKMDHTSGYWLHGVQYYITQFTPMWIRMKIADFLMHSFRNEYFSLKTKK